MQEQMQVLKIEKLHLQEQIEKERKNKERDYISEWFRWVELTQKYLKNKLN